MQGCRRSWEDELKCVKILSVKDHNSAKICRTWIISPHALPDLCCNIPAKFHSNPCKGCRRSWEDKLECVKILSVRDHNSAKICRTWIISPHALLGLWCNIPAKFHSNPCKDVGGVEKTNFDGTEGRTKQTLNAPLPFYGGGIKTKMPQYDWKWSAENDVILCIQIKDGGRTNINSVNVIENVQLRVN